MRRTHFSPGTQKKKGPAGGLVSGSRMVCGGGSQPSTQLSLVSEATIADRGKDTLNRVRGPDVLPMLGWEFVEGQ